MLQDTLDSETYLPNCDLTIWLRSCRKEISDPVPGLVSFGHVPKWLKGSLVRNGPGGINVYGDKESKTGDRPDCKHLFDSPGLLQKFSFCDGQVHYSNRFVQTKSHLRNTAAKRLVLSEFGTVATPDPCQSIFHRIFAVFNQDTEDMITDTANISIYPFGDEVYTLAETGFAHRIDLETLDTTKHVNVINELGIINHTSHPHVFDSLNKVYNIGQKLDIWNGPRYIIAEMDTKPSGTKIEDTTKSPWSEAKILAEIPSRWLFNSCYMHSFSMTENYFIIIEQPLCIFFPEIPVNMVTGSKPLISSLKFYSEEDTLFKVIPRHGNGEMTVFKSPSFFFLHTINSFETPEGDIIVDICYYKDPKMIDCMYIDSLKNAHSNPNFAEMFRGRPMRFHLKMSSSKANNDSSFIFEAHQEQIVDFGCETPRINNLFNAKEYQYFYAISTDVDLDHSGWLIKVNTKDKSFKKWGEPTLNSYGSEPIFVPNPGPSQGEDDGIILSTLLYGGENYQGVNKTSAVILDARKWELLAKIDFHPGISIPKCLHGWFFPSEPSQQGQ